MALRAPTIRDGMFVVPIAPRVTFHPDLRISEALRMLADAGKSEGDIVEHGKCLGAATRDGLLEALKAQPREPTEAAVAAISDALKRGAPPDKISPSGMDTGVSG